VPSAQPNKPAPALKIINGVIERITFQNSETGYTIAKLSASSADGDQPQGANDKEKLVTVVGTLVGAAVGEALELTGVWQHHTQHGWQFMARNYRSVLPATTQGIRKYLGSGLIKGVGPRTAEKIVAHFGERTLDILESTPEQLYEVPNIGRSRVVKITNAWVEQKAIKEVMVFLQGHGVSTSLAVRLYKQYGDAAITIAKNQPYRLAREVWGIGFKTADKIAQAMGVRLDDPERLKAGALFALSEASDEGHTYLPNTQLVSKASELLGVAAPQIEQAIAALAAEDGARVEVLSIAADGQAHFKPFLGGKDEGLGMKDEGLRMKEMTANSQSPIPNPQSLILHPLSFIPSSLIPSPNPLTIRENRAAYTVVTSEEIHEIRDFEMPDAEQTPQLPSPMYVAEGEPVVYLPPFYVAEQNIVRQLRRLGGAEAIAQSQLSEFRAVKFEAMFEYLASSDRLALSAQQQQGVRMALTAPVSVLTGGPGTGKTTSMRALIRALILKKKRVILAAPTGRAAKRLSEATGIEAKTLHRLLQLRPGGKAAYDADKPIPADMVIVDETSMLDTLLMNTLLKAIGSGTHVLLVGDADQLPSVGAGNVLADIIDSGLVPVLKLDQIFRQSARSAMITNAHRINRGESPQLGGEISDFYLFAEEDAEKASALVVDVVARRIPAKFGIAPSDIQVLVPMHGGKCGVANLNELLQAALNPPRADRPHKPFGERLYRVGDKVLQMRNNYDKDVFNGDAGVIKLLDLEEQTLTVQMDDGRLIEYDFSDLDQLALAYAISIHKSQGSEYAAVVIPLVMNHYMMLERKLLYTAVTRAKKLVVLVGSRKAVELAVRNAGGSNRAHRYTGLAVRLREGAG
jgi:exodeoxyribonuclease V alpha subunit